MGNLPATVGFAGRSLAVVNRDGVPFLSAADLSRALDYSNVRAVSRLHSMHAGEFTDDMTRVLESSTRRGIRYQTRIFSPRGCHLVAMFARTPIAAEFRRWVLDVLDKLAEQPNALPAPTLRNRRWLVSIEDDGSEQVTPIPNDACVMTVDHFVEAISVPGNLAVPTATLARFIAIAAVKLAQRATPSTTPAPAGKE